MLILNSWKEAFEGLKYCQSRRETKAVYHLKADEGKEVFSVAGIKTKYANEKSLVYLMLGTDISKIMSI